MQRAVEDEWHALAQRFPDVRLDAFVTMPNHVHGVVFIDGYACMEPAREPSSLSAVIGAFKSLSAKRVNQLLSRAGPVWQRSYYERVIRDEDELNRIRRYIIENPARWALDHENPEFRR